MWVLNIVFIHRYLFFFIEMFIIHSIVLFINFKYYEKKCFLKLILLIICFFFNIILLKGIILIKDMF